MPSRMDFPRPMTPPEGDGAESLDLSLYVKLLLVTGMEVFAFVLHYAAYVQTMTIMPGTYLSDIAGLGWMFAQAPEMTVNHLIAGLLAAATVATPVFGFMYLIRNNVIEDHGAFFAYVPNRIYVVALGLFWALMVSVEIVNVLTLIDQYTANPFLSGAGGNQMAEALRDHRGLAILSTVVIAIVNTALGLATAKLWLSVLHRREG